MVSQGEIRLRAATIGSAMRVEQQDYGGTSDGDDGSAAQADAEPPPSLSGASSALVSVNTMLGPGLLAIPFAFQQGGWLPCVCALTLGGLVTADVAVMFARAIDRTRGRLDGPSEDCLNEELRDLSGRCEPSARPRGKLEFAPLARHYGGRSLELVTQGLLVVSLLALACAQIIATAEAMDGFIVWVFGKTYALAPLRSGGAWISSGKLSVMPFPPDTVGLSLGFLLNAAICITLGALPLSENIGPQCVFFCLFCFALAVFLWHFFDPRYDPVTFGDGRLPMIGGNLSGVLGVVIFNYAYVVAVPSLRADCVRGERFGKAMWGAVGFMWLMYMLYGLAGSLAFRKVEGNLLVSILRPEVPGVTKAAVFALSFALQASIPCYIILLARSLAEAGCRRPVFWANAVPWALALGCYMQTWFSSIINWSGLLVLGFINYSVPLAIAALAFGGGEAFSFQTLRCAVYALITGVLVFACIAWNLAA